jgi:SpoIID/LytB domain protein
VGGQITSVPIDEYVLGAVLSEVTPLDETPAAVDRIYEVQAIIARTYAVSQIGRHHAEGFDVCDTTHCQIYDPARVRTSRFTTVARAAVTRTQGRVLSYGGHVAEALFHADCGGSTTGADAVWGGRAFPYLRAIEDNLTPETHRKWEVTATNEQLRVALDADARTNVGKSLTAIEILSRDDSGRAAGLGVRGERSYTVRGDVLRSVLNQSLAGRGLQSTKFTLARSATATPSKAPASAMASASASAAPPPGSAAETPSRRCCGLLPGDDADERTVVGPRVQGSKVQVKVQGLASPKPWRRRVQRSDSSSCRQRNSFDDFGAIGSGHCETGFVISRLEHRQHAHHLHQTCVHARAERPHMQAVEVVLDQAREFRRRAWQVQSL